MAVVRGFEEYRQLQRKRQKALGRIQKQTPIKGAKFLAAELRATAPRKTGRLIGTINRKGKTVRISGVNPLNGFPYIHWINGTKGFRVLHYKRSNAKYNIPKGAKLVYGSTPSHWNWTAKQGFVTLARFKSRRWFTNVIVKDTKKALNVQIR